MFVESTRIANDHMRKHNGIILLCYYSLVVYSIIHHSNNQAGENQTAGEEAQVAFLWGDPQDAELSGMITHFCESGETLVGKKANDKANIKLNGVG